MIQYDDATVRGNRLHVLPCYIRLPWYRASFCLTLCASVRTAGHFSAIIEHLVCHSLSVSEIKFSVFVRIGWEVQNVPPVQWTSCCPSETVHAKFLTVENVNSLSANHSSTYRLRMHLITKVHSGNRVSFRNVGLLNTKPYIPWHARL